MLNYLYRYRLTDLFDNLPGDFFILYFSCLYWFHFYSHFRLLKEYTTKRDRRQGGRKQLVCLQIWLYHKSIILKQGEIYEIDFFGPSGGR